MHSRHWFLPFIVITIFAASGSFADNRRTESCFSRGPIGPVASSSGPYGLTLRVLGPDGGATPCRVAVFDSNGNPVVPEPPEQFMFQALGTRSYFYSNGSVTLSVANDEYTIHLAKGFEHNPLTVQVAVAADTVIEVSMERWIDLGANGWFSGETHTHLTHTPVYYDLAPQDMVTVMLAEDLHYMNVMDREEFFTGAPHPLSPPGRTLSFSLEYRNPHFGHLSLVGLRQWIAEQGCDTGIGACGRTLNGVIAGQVHEQEGATVILTHPLPTENYQDLSPWPGGGVGRGLPIDLVGGHIDAMDILCYTHLDPPRGLEEYFAALNAGFKLPASAGTDAVLSTGRSEPPGGYRLYVRVGDGPSDYTPENWVDGMRAGRSFVTNGPLFDTFILDGQGPGSIIRTAARKLRGRVIVESAFPIEKVEIIAEGDVMETFMPDQKQVGALFRGSFVVPTDSIRWIVARVTGPASSGVIGATGLFAQTSPIYIELDGADPGTYVEKKRAAAGYFITRLEGTKALFGSRGNFPGDSRAAFDSACAEALVYYHGLVPDPPASFELVAPMFWSESHGAVVTPSTTPTLRWRSARDDDPGDKVTYKVSYGADPNFAGATIVSGLLETQYEVPSGSPLQAQTTYHWKVEATDLLGHVTASTPAVAQFIVDPTATSIGATGTPWRWWLGAVRPNPFNPTVTFEYEVPRDGGRYTIEIVDVRGGVVRTLESAGRGAGRYTLTWDGRDGNGIRVASGVFFIRLNIVRTGETLVDKIVLIK